MRICIAMMGHLLDPDLNPGVKKGAGNWRNKSAEN